VARHANIVTITVERSGGEREVRIVGRHEHELTLKVPDEKWEGARGAVHGHLDAFKNEVLTLSGRLEVPPSSAHKALRVLFNRGCELASELVGGTPISDVQELFENAWPWWRTSDDVPRVAVEGDVFGFPFELLPVFDFNRAPDITDAEGIKRFARRFLGFTAAIRRAPKVSDPGHAGWERREDAPIRVSFLRHAGLAGADQEEGWFKTRGDRLDLDGPWPYADMDGAAVLDGAMKTLVDPLVRLDGMPSDHEADVHHFACHCDTDANEDRAWALTIAGPEKDSERRLQLGDLRSHWIQHTAAIQRSAVARRRPLVFINACGASRIDPMKAGSFPDWFLVRGHAGYIGSETAIPDRFAATYSAEFYSRVLKGAPVGDALVQAKRKLLAEYLNPLGVLYVMYADPDLVLCPTALGTAA
jgi:CHAT domain